MFKEYLYNKECTVSLLKGAQQVADTVGTTFGANGRKVLIEKRGQVPKHTKDGVSVAKEIVLENKFDNVGAQSLIEVSLQLLSKVGDGTTTAILLAEAFLQQLINYDPNRETREQFKKHLYTLVDLFEKNSISGKDAEILEGVAYISSNGDQEITKLLREAINHIGENGNILVDPSSSSFTKVRLEEGIYMPLGYALQEFANNQIKSTGEYQDAYLVLYDGRIDSFDYMAVIVREIAAKEAITPIIFIATEISQDALVSLAANVLHGKLNSAAVVIGENEKYASELLKDISAATGVPIFGKKYRKPLGHMAHSVKKDDLGKVSKIRLTKDSTIILPYPEKVTEADGHLKWLKDKLDATEDENEINNLNTRIARVSQKIALIQVGGATRQVMMEKRDRIEDAVCAVLQARKKGVLPGGGLPFINALKYLDNEPDSGAEILKRSLLKVLWRLYVNSAWEIKFEKEDFTLPEGSYRPYSIIEESFAIKRLMDKFSDLKFAEPKAWNGLNLETNKECNLYDARIFDPTSVITTTLITAGECALSLMNTGASIAISRKVDLSGIDSVPEYAAN